MSNNTEKISIVMHPKAFAAFGADLVTNDVVALIELVKNSYDAFAYDVKRLGITELFERKHLEDSIEALRKSLYVKDRSRVRAISYPI